MGARQVCIGLTALGLPALNLLQPDPPAYKSSKLPFFLQVNRPDSLFKHDLANTRWEVYQISPSQADIGANCSLRRRELSVGEAASHIFVQPRHRLSSYFTGPPGALINWVESLQEPITYISEENQLLDVLRSRDRGLQSAAVIVAFVAPGDEVKLEKFKHFVTLYFCDSSVSTSLMSRHGLVTAKFVVVTDAKVAQRMFILPEGVLGESVDDLLIYKYYQPSSVFYRYLADDFRDTEALANYEAYAVRRKREVDLDLRQLRLKLNRTKYVLTDDASRLRYDSIRVSCVPETATSHIKDLAKSVATEDFVVLPWGRSMDAMKSMDAYYRQRNLPSLVVAYDACTDAGQVAKQLDLHGLARERLGELLVIVGARPIVKAIHDSQHSDDALGQVEVVYYNRPDHKSDRQVYQVTPTTSATDLREWLGKTTAPQSTEVRGN
jgi:hypothetical protein